MSRGALFGALGLILGAIAGWFRGRAGAVDPTVTNRALAYDTSIGGQTRTTVEVDAPRTGAARNYRS